MNFRIDVERVCGIWHLEKTKKIKKSKGQTITEKKDKFEDKALNKLFGTNIETRRISYDELVDMVDRIFVRQAVDEKGLDKIRKTCSDGVFATITTMGGYIKTLTSLDGKYELVFQTSNKRTVVAIAKGSFVFIKDLETEVVYQLDKNHDRKKFIKAVKNLVNDRKKSLNITVDESDDEDEDVYEPEIASEETVENIAESVENEVEAEAEPEPENVADQTDTIFCMNCGQKIPKVAKFCPHCGQKNIFAE